VMDHAAEGWRSCKDIAERSQTYPRYLHAASASTLFHDNHLPGLPHPNDLNSLMVLERTMALKALRQRDAGPSGPASVHIRADVVNVNAPEVHVSEGQQAGKAKPKQKTRMKRAAAEPLILKHLLRRPNDSSRQVADAVGCSTGVVVESQAWRANRARLRVAEKEGRDPKAVDLDVAWINEHGASTGGQMHAFRLEQKGRDDEIDRRERELFKLIGEYRNAHPKATPSEVARVVGCTAGDVERHQVMLKYECTQQAESAAEEENVIGPDGRMKGKKKQKWRWKKP